MMRRNLIDRRFDQEILAPINDPKDREQECDELTTVRLIADDPPSSNDIRTPT